MNFLRLLAGYLLLPGRPKTKATPSGGSAPCEAGGRGGMFLLPGRPKTKAAPLGGIIFLCTLLGACAYGPSLEDRMTARRAADLETAQTLVATAPAGDDLPQWINIQRERITQGRSAAATSFANQEKLCWKRFTVNACIRDASDERRATLDRLRQEDLTLNDLERKRRTESRLQGLEKKQGGKD